MKGIVFIEAVFKLSKKFLSYNGFKSKSKARIWLSTRIEYLVKYLKLTIKKI